MGRLLVARITSGVSRMVSFGLRARVHIRKLGFMHACVHLLLADFLVQTSMLCIAFFTGCLYSGGI